MKRMLMYTQNVCPKCDIAKVQLDMIPAEFKPQIEYINIDKHPEAKDYMMTELDSMSTPTFEFRNEDGSKGRVVRGFEMGEIQEELGM